MQNAMKSNHGNCGEKKIVWNFNEIRCESFVSVGPLQASGPVLSRRCDCPWFKKCLQPRNKSAYVWHFVTAEKIP